MKDIPKVYVHPLTTLISPYDIAYNRMREKVMLHGSCGMGVGAAMKRNDESPYKLYCIDMLNEDVLSQKLKGITIELRFRKLSQLRKLSIVRREATVVNCQLKFNTLFSMI